MALFFGSERRGSQFFALILFSHFILPVLIINYIVMSAASRSSRRIAGEAAEAPPPLSAAAKGSRLRSTLARDFYNGKPIESDPAIHWKLDGTSPMNLAFLSEQYARSDSSDDSDFKIEDDSVGEESDGSDFIRALNFDDEASGVKDAEDEDEDAEGEVVEVRPSTGSKLIPFPELKSLVESNCVCQGCASKGVVSLLTLTEETYGLATNLNHLIAALSTLLDHLSLWKLKELFC